MLIWSLFSFWPLNFDAAAIFCLLLYQLALEVDLPLVLEVDPPLVLEIDPPLVVEVECCFNYFHNQC